MSDASERRLATAWANKTPAESIAMRANDPDLYWALMHWMASHGAKALASIRCLGQQ